MAVVPKFVGERVKRREDPRLITGTATYVDDLRLPGMLHALILRSPHAHAKINSIDIEAARKASGVIAVLTAAELKNKIGSLPCAAIAEHKPFHPVLAKGKVRYVGEPIAVVVAADPYKAQDALDLVEVDYDPLEAVVDPEKALEPGAPLIHEKFGTNLVHRAEVPGPGVEEAMHRAHRIIKFRIVNQRLAPMPIEATRRRRAMAPGVPATHAVVVDPDSASIAQRPRRDAQSGGEPYSRDRPRGRRRLWLQAQCLSRRSTHSVSCDRFGQAHQVDRAPS